MASKLPTRTHATRGVSTRRVVDWADIAAAYRAEPGAGPAIARRFGISPATLRRRARAEEWARDAPTGPPVAAVPDDGPTHDVPSSKPLPGLTRPVDVLGGHRIVVAQGAALTLQLLDDLQSAIAEESGLDDGAEESGLSRAAALQKRVAALRDLAAAARLWIALERQAWDLDGKGDAKNRDDTAIPDTDAAIRLLDEGQRAQLRAIAERLSHARPLDAASLDAANLAGRPAGPDPRARPAR
ncbi:hypothetical protein SAMN02799631_05274 [Methylobacterium sp. 174MFSha1.1]|uniref:hypothetical protein n=1 Tax=Methylobacterium sp. 174MFSha1.1 TaxID=1502749 RepID=UPI0008E16359|nr:hypothetical protein [Methylobacterium sp. 174MFSha1.1]SFV11449.1 hypothetical protein SAMN02799631_05274 [Methylobacterium sp. 174MFSha1.1]